MIYFAKRKNPHVFVRIQLKDLYETTKKGEISASGFKEWIMYYRYKHWGIGLDEGRKEERDEMQRFIDEFRGQENERNEMFGEGYDFALEQMESFIKGRERR
jgi:hypothetical protein